MRTLLGRKAIALWAALAIAVVGITPALAATLVINNTNAAGVGFNDPAARAPVGGNPGTTLGAQRLYIFNYAAAIWGSELPDNITITINASFAAQTCTATSATLGSTSSLSSFRDFAGAPVAGHWYKQSLANKLANTDLDLVRNDMQITFNLSIDSGCFGPGQVWYYGTDGNEGTNIEMLPVVLHEIGHGLGFATLTSGTSGAYASGFPDIYDKFLLDKNTNLHWDQNTAAQRVASAIALDKLVWDGPEVVSYATKFLSVGQPEVFVNAPGAIAGSLYTAQDATFGAAITTAGFTGNVVLLTDTTAPVNDGCEAITNAGALAGNIALIDRGICTFAAKCAAAQAAGATGVIIVNNVAAGLPGMGGTDPTITIPCVGISQADGNAIKAQLANGVNVTIRRSPTVHAGADAANRPKMYTPNPFASGSSVSHWDISLTPNATMEPAINADLHTDLDLTPSQMRDIGWYAGSNVVGSQSTSTVICPSNPCVTLPVNIQRSDTTPLLGYSVTFKLSPNLSLCAGPSSITEGTYLSGSGATSFQIIDNGDGSYTVDDVILGPGCGPTGSTGNLFNVGVTSSAPGGTGQLTVTAVKLRDCNNVPLPAMPGNIGGVPIDNTPPVVTVNSPNGGESWLIGSTQNITWTATDNVAVSNVDIAYSTDGGATYPNVIATGIANSGSYAWTVPNTPTTTARVRVTAHDTGCLSGADASDANFAIRNPIITASAGPGGSISPSGAVSVVYGTNQTFTITVADKCHVIANVLVDGVSVGPVATYTFTGVTTDHTIAASFTLLGPYTITASAGAGGTISPSGPTSVACGGSQSYVIAPSDKCHVIADVLVDGVSVGAVTNYTFSDVQANHTIAASFTLLGPYTITASAGAGGTISPNGATSVACGGSQTYTIAPSDKCHVIADVLVDGVSVGAVGTYTFSDVQANHTIAASFSLLGPYTITASAGAGGTISPNGPTSVPCGGSQSYVIAPSDKCHVIADVLVDGVSVGAVANYTFSDVQANHTIAASFSVLGPYTITASAGAGGTISPNGATSVPCGGSQSYVIAPSDKCHVIADVLVDGVSVGAVGTYTFSDVQANHTIAASFSVLGPYTITASAGAGGTISPNGATAVACGGTQKFDITPNACFHVVNVLVDGVSVGPVTTYTFSDVQANHTISATFAPNTLATTAVTGLTAVQVRSGNDADGTTKVTITYTTPAGAAAVEVWRKGYGNYPLYDDAPGSGSVPPVPGSYPPAGWTLTSVSASGQADEPSTRDFWYYVAYAKDACGNVAPVSNMTSGTLDYHLGDVSDGVTPGQGNNQVSTADVSLLGAHYGATGGALAPYRYLDVGPTTTTTVHGRPTTDNRVEFEDLVMFALNYLPNATITKPAPVGDVVASTSTLSIQAPASVTAGQEFTVRLKLTGGGDLQALSTTLQWNAAVAEPTSYTAGNLLADETAIVLSSAPGVVDAALLGAREVGMTGSGDLAIVHFHALAAGAPSVVIDHVLGRDSENHPVTVATSITGTDLSAVSSNDLGRAAPNPTTGRTVLNYSLAARSDVDLSIYSVDGRRVVTLVRGEQAGGPYQSNWDGRDEQGNVMRSGIYFIRLNVDGARFTRRLVIQR